MADIHIMVKPAVAVVGAQHGKTKLDNEEHGTYDGKIKIKFGGVRDKLSNAVNHGFPSLYFPYFLDSCEMHISQESNQPSVISYQ
jgi:hypothetical protein